MFPYTGMLQYISAKNAYSMDDIQELQNFAKANNLKVMPLIQTFGHMEFVLKSDFNKLRENAYTPQVIDITQNASYSLIAEMVKQILNAHPDATHLHVGCDEVYELGKGATSLQMKSQNLSEAQMFLRHVQRVASIVREYNGRGVKAIIWDDELRKISLRDLQGSRLSYLVEIMVWHYTKRVSEIIRSDVWNKYARVFKSVWIASAFKGATGARQFFTEPDYHIQNHFGWLDVIAANNQQVNFKGVALTGWQRYDHFATLCELLPVSLPSLAVCLANDKWRIY
uniref:beta-N-acetylhexosaminidase n=1 Tax=Arion vulgaris TaxID=1028688 RepID=A0A0B7BHY6_9EUPU